MKNETDLACSFIQDPERDFYIALHSDLYRILRYDTDHIMEVGIERAEYELNCLLTYLVGRVVCFSDGYVLLDSGWRNRCAAGDEIGRAYFRSEAQYAMLGGIQQDFKTSVAYRLRLWAKEGVMKLAGIWACGTDDESHKDYKLLQEYAEEVYRKVLGSGKTLEQFLEALGREIEEWDGQSEPNDMYLDDIHKCRWITAVPIDMSGLDPYLKWAIDNGYSCEYRFLHRQAEAPPEPIYPDQSPCPIEPALTATLKKEEENEEVAEIAPTPDFSKKLHVFGMEWHGTQADLIDFVAWASNNELIKEYPTAIAENMMSHGGFGGDVETLRVKISKCKKRHVDKSCPAYSNNSYAKEVKKQGRAPEKDTE